MELPSKLLEQIAFNTRPKIEKHMLIVLDKSTHEEPLSQPQQTNNKQFKIAVTFLTGYNGIFNVTNLNIKFYFKKNFNDREFTEISIPQGANKIEALSDEIKRNIIDKGHYTESNYPFIIKLNFSTLGSIVEIYQTGAIISFVKENIIGKLLGFDETISYNEYNQSINPVDIISVDNIFIGTDFAKRMIFRERRNGNIMNFTMQVSPGYNFVNRFDGGVQWYMMESKDVFSSISFKFKKRKRKFSIVERAITKLSFINQGTLKHRYIQIYESYMSIYTLTRIM